MISELLNSLTPSQSYTLFVSKAHKEVFDASQFEKEEIYGTQYVKIKLTQE
jgi:hypothetical protein